MLDLNYVRENLASVRAALEKRGLPPELLDPFEEADAERRRAIAESDLLNLQRNEASGEIAKLKREGLPVFTIDPAGKANELKQKIAAQNKARDQAEARSHELLSTLPNVPHARVPVGKDE